MKYDLKNHELDNNFFNFPEVLSNDFLKIDPFSAANTNSSTFINIREIVLNYLEKNKELSIDGRLFRVRKIRYTKDDKPELTAYAVSGVFLNVFDKEVKYEDFTSINTDLTPYIFLPDFADDETVDNIIIFTDVLNQLIERPRTFVNYKESKLLKEISVEDETDFVRDCYYFKYLFGTYTLINWFYRIKYESRSRYGLPLLFLFLFSRMTSEEYIDNRGINVVSDITDEDMKSIICSYLLFEHHIFEEIKTYKNFPFERYVNACCKPNIKNGELVSKPQLGDWVVERFKKDTENIVSIMEIISSEDFQKAIPLVKVRMLY